MILQNLVEDLRGALRNLRRSPGFVVTAVVVLALGSAITGAVFSTVNGWLSVATAIPNAHRLIVVGRMKNGAADPTGYFTESSYTRLFDLRLQTVRDLFATQPVPAVLSLDTLAVNVRMEAVTGGYFSAIGVAPLLGRPLQGEDDRAGGDTPIVLSEALWKRMFAADRHVIGRSVRVSGLTCTIVGVMPASVRGFSVPTATAVDVWAPAAGVRALIAPSGKVLWGQVFGRLVDGATFQQAQAEVRAVGQFDPDNRDLGAALFPVERGVMPGRARFALGVAGTGLVALSALVLLIACANLANLLLARSASRSSELAVRMALGASPARILRLQLIETTALTLLGGAAGFILVGWLSRVTGRFEIQLERGFGSGALLVDVWLLGYFLVLIALTSFAVGILPALRTIRLDPASVLASVGARGRSTGRFERNRTLLVASQVAASTVLLILAALFVRSAVNASQYPVAFQTRTVALGFLDFAALRVDEPRAHDRQQAILTVARSIPGVRSVALATDLPARGGGELVAVATAPDAGVSGTPCRSLSVTPGFFDVIGPVSLRGRDFIDSETDHAGGVAIVNDAAATRLWPHGDAIGQTLRIRGGSPLTVVGVVTDTDRAAREVSDRCYVFVPMMRRYTPHFVLAIAGSLPAESMLKPLTETFARTMPDVAMFDVKTADAHLARGGGASRSMALALLGLGVVGLTIAIVGLYGVISYLVGLRRSEFGIRKVLGATDAQIYRLVSLDACRMLGLGVLTGLPLAYAASTALSSGLIGVTPSDPTTYLAVPACLLIVGVLAAWWPARRAACVEPAVALRDL